MPAISLRASRILATRSALRELGKRLGETAAGGDPDVLFYGSGDFHHLTALQVRQRGEPLTIVHFDNHPDWVRYPTINCGSWVNQALCSPNVARIMTIGPCSDDLRHPEWKFAEFAGDPQRASQPLCLAKRADAPMGCADCGAWASTAGGILVWRNLEGECWDDFLEELTASLPETALWITIDKDVLRRSEAITNWDQGEMTLDQIAAALRRLAASFSRRRGYLWRLFRATA